MSIRRIKCNNCQYEFDFDGDRDFAFCESCGMRIELNSPAGGWQGSPAPQNPAFDPYSTEDAPTQVLINPMDTNPLNTVPAENNAGAAAQLPPEDAPTQVLFNPMDTNPYNTVPAENNGNEYASQLPPEDVPTQVMFDPMDTNPYNTVPEKNNGGEAASQLPPEEVQTQVMFDPKDADPYNTVPASLEQQPKQPEAPVPAPAPAPAPQNYNAPYPAPQQYAPTPQPMAQPAPQYAPVQQAPVQRPVQPNAPAFVPPVYPQQVKQKFEPTADLSIAIKCYNIRDYETANKCLELLKESEPENFEVWFCACKILAAQKPADITATLTAYIEAASNCVKYASDEAGVRGNVTIEYNRFLKNITDAIIIDALYLQPYDKNVMSEMLPSANYQPLGKVDEYYFMLMDNIKEFQKNVNPNYLTNYFTGIWDSCFYCFAHEITTRMVMDFNSSKLFSWYVNDFRSRSSNPAVLNAMCDLLYGYKNVFINLFNRLPYRDTKTKAVNRIAYINKYLLKMKRIDQFGREYLFIANPGQRQALEMEIRNYKIMLSQS